MKSLIYFFMICLGFGIVLIVNSVEAGTVHVNGYYKNNGTYVRPHTRTAPDGIKWNNKSNW